MPVVNLSTGFGTTLPLEPPITLDLFMIKFCWLELPLGVDFIVEGVGTAGLAITFFAVVLSL